MTTSVVIISIIIIKIAVIRKIIIFTAIFIMIMNFIIFYLKLAKIHFTSNTQLIIIQDPLIQVRRPAIKYTILFKKRLQSNHQKAWVPQRSIRAEKWSFKPEYGAIVGSPSSVRLVLLDGLYARDDLTSDV